MALLRIGLVGWLVFLTMGRATAETSPTAPAARAIPNLQAKSATELVIQGLPAISLDGTRVAYVKSTESYDDSASETLVITKIATGQIEKSLTLRKTDEGGEKKMPLKRVREAIRSANQLVKELHPLTRYEVRKEPIEGHSSTEEKGEPYYRHQQGTRQLTYSLRTGRLELTEGKSVLLKEVIKTSRPWYCCGQADPQGGGCTRAPETVSGAWGDDAVLVMFFGFRSGPDGCEIDKDRRVMRLTGTPTASLKK